MGIHEDTAIKTVVRDLALEGYEGPGAPEFASLEKYVWLRETGSRLWLDTGDSAAAEEAWSAELEALTTNNTLVNQVVQTGAMDGLVAYAARKIREARPDISGHDLVIEIAFLVNARLALSLVQKFGAHVSVELHPDLGSDIESTVAFARRYYEINPEYFYIKAPMTPDGFVSVRKLSREGIPVNFTLGFSARQNYLAARFSKPRFVNVFLGRLNSLVEENGIGSPENVGEKAALASAEIVEGVRASGGGESYQIAASIRNGGQIAALAGVDVLTMPPKAAGEYLESDLTRDAVARRNWRDLQVELDLKGLVEPEEISRLWEIDGAFKSFVDDAVRRSDELQSGSDLVELSRKHGVGLFRDWTGEDRQRIREKGKIPDLTQWPGAPVDDLMSMSALETFAKDQAALDARIAELAG